jgi:hypothetical protein
MYATIRRYDHVAGSPEELLRAGRALAARVSQAPGFVSCAALDGGAGVLAAVCFFETEADLAAADRLLEAWAAEQFPPLRPGAPQVTGGEVVAQKGL